VGNPPFAEKGLKVQCSPAELLAVGFWLRAFVRFFCFFSVYHLTNMAQGPRSPDAHRDASLCGLETSRFKILSLPSKTRSGWTLHPFRLA